ncbi:hypothetical protein CSAL01_13179 [Colletotrichum salicis]|uniref:Uncharacterized protein n=1 Tax=Colletotrichum salicis TaxID=1209931 RepID=A0A135V488_9PEZI|nr:hypothetical protein CSAL01_13179 [Colletotrichum salicis]
MDVDWKTYGCPALALAAAASSRLRSSSANLTRLYGSCDGAYVGGGCRTCCCEGCRFTDSVPATAVTSVPAVPAVLAVPAVPGACGVTISIMGIRRGCCAVYGVGVGWRGSGGGCVGAPPPTPAPAPVGTEPRDPPPPSDEEE